MTIEKQCARRKTHYEMLRKQSRKLKTLKIKQGLNSLKQISVPFATLFQQKSVT